MARGNPYVRTVMAITECLIFGLPPGLPGLPSNTVEGENDRMAWRPQVVPRVKENVREESSPRQTELRGTTAGDQVDNVPPLA